MDQVSLDLLSPELVSRVSGKLLEWFQQSARDLPWRHGRTPYRVWISEVMLQQTRAETVIPYFERFLEHFPTVDALARSSLNDVLKLWEGLGYYARARNLHQAAQQLVNTTGGKLPGTFEELEALPGVGTYTAGAIASIAFGERVPAVDGNARRVICRLFRIQEDVTRSATKRKLTALAGQLLPGENVGSFNEALIELGATLCTPQRPACSRCPIGAECRAYAYGEQDALPVRAPRRKTPHYDVAAAVTVREDGAVLIAQRNVDDMLGGLWEFPGGKCEEDESLRQSLVREMKEELSVRVEVGEELLVVEHAYTHFSITLHAFWCRLQDGEPRCLECAAFRWALPRDLDGFPMSVADRKVAEAVAAAAVGPGN